MHSSPLGKPGSRDTGGMTTYLRESSRALGRLGWRVDLFTRDGGSDNARVVAVGPNSRLVYLGDGEGKLLKLELYPHLEKFSEKLEQFRREQALRYDLVFSHYWLSGLAGRLLGQWWGVPHLLMYHTLGAVKNASCGGEKEPALRIDSEKFLAGDCDRLIVAAEREKCALVRYYDAAPGRIRVVPCGVNLELFRPLERRRAKEQLGLGGTAVALFVGRIEPVKGLDLLIEALGYLPDSLDYKLLVAGGDAASRGAVARLAQKSRMLGVAGRVIFSGRVEHEDLPLYYSAADVTVIPSHYESFGMTALESLACGTPVVSTDVGDLKQIIRRGETGYVLDGRSPVDLAAKLALCLDGNHLRPPPAIRDTVSRMGWPSVARRLVAAFAELGVN